MINKIKEFINLREDLKTSGVIGISVWDNDIHVKLSVLSEMPNVQFKPMDDADYPFTAFTTVDGVKLFSLVKKDEVKNFPQLEGFMEEDVILDGESDVV